MTLDSFGVCLTDKFGQRAFVGKVCMDLNDTVPEYKETTEESVKETERYVCLGLPCGWSWRRREGTCLTQAECAHLSLCQFV